MKEQKKKTKEVWQAEFNLQFVNIRKCELIHSVLLLSSLMFIFYLLFSNLDIYLIFDFENLKEM